MSGVFTNGEAHHQQGKHLCNEYHGEDTQANQFLEQSLVSQHLGHQAQAGQRQDAGKRQRLVEFQPQREILTQQV